MSRRLKSYLRTYRRRHGLTQDEVALLIGLKSGTHVSRIERLVRPPSATTLIACSSIFSVSAEDLYPELHDQIRFGVGKRAEALYDALQGESDRATRAKLDLLETIIRQASAPGSSLSL